MVTLFSATSNYQKLNSCILSFYFLCLSGLELILTFSPHKQYPSHREVPIQIPADILPD